MNTLSFSISVSTNELKYDEFKKIDDWKNIIYSKREITLDEFIQVVEENKAFCHSFGKKDTFTVSQKSYNNFNYADFTVFDIDDVSFSLEKFIEVTRLKPTFAYSTPGDLVVGGKYKGLHRFRLIYLLKNRVYSVRQYRAVNQEILKVISEDIKEHLDKSFTMNDECGKSAAHQFGGCFNPNETFRSESIYENKPFTDDMADDKRVKVNFSSHILNDSYNEDFTEKYSHLRRPWETEITYNRLHYAVLGDDYHAVPLPKKTDYKSVHPEPLKWKDGQKRHSKMYVSANIIAHINECIDVDTLFYNLILLRDRFYIRKADEFTNTYLYKLAVQTVNKKEPFKFRKFKSRIKVDTVWCQSNKTDARAYAQFIRKFNNLIKLIDAYDFNMSVNENVKRLDGVFKKDAVYNFAKAVEKGDFTRYCLVQKNRVKEYDFDDIEFGELDKYEVRRDAGADTCLFKFDFFNFNEDERDRLLDTLVNGNNKISFGSPFYNNTIEEEEYRQKIENDTINDPKENILKEIEKNPTVTRKQLSEILNVSDVTIKRKLKQLTNDGKIKRVGGKKQGHWEIVEDDTCEIETIPEKTMEEKIHELFNFEHQITGDVYDGVDVRILLDEFRELAVRYGMNDDFLKNVKRRVIESYEYSSHYNDRDYAKYLMYFNEKWNIPYDIPHEEEDGTSHYTGDISLINNTHYVSGNDVMVFLNNKLKKLNCYD